MMAMSHERVEEESRGSVIAAYMFMAVYGFILGFLVAWWVL